MLSRSLSFESSWLPAEAAASSALSVFLRGPSQPVQLVLSWLLPVRIAPVAAFRGLALAVKLAVSPARPGRGAVPQASVPAGTSWQGAPALERLAANQFMPHTGFAA
jgi:hypothetical protein